MACQCHMPDCGPVYTCLHVCLILWHARSQHLCRLLCTRAMFSNHRRAFERNDQPAEKRARRNIEDFLMSNTVSGRRTQLLVHAGASGSKDCAAVARPVVYPKNAARDLRRWPAAGVHVALQSQGRDPMLQPENQFGGAARGAFPPAPRASGAVAPGGQRPGLGFLQRAKQEAGGPLLPLGLWGDGCPCNWDRTESFEVVALSLPGQEGQFAGLRMPITALSRKSVAHPSVAHPVAYSGVMAIAAWSLGAAAVGAYPPSRHDGPLSGPATLAELPKQVRTWASRRPWWRFAVIGNFTRRPLA